MREYQPIDTHAQKEALINEFKGNLFEYLVGQLLSRHYKIEGDFVRSFGGDIRKQLTEYDHWLRVNEPNLIKHLPLLAKGVLDKILPSLPNSATHVYVIGKTVAGPHSKRWAEADIVVQDEKTVYPISLKLCKAQAFVNTKSAGIKSFVSQYFSGHEQCDFWQNKINEGVQKRFELMAQDLHDRVGLEFYGRFDHRWVESGHSELPGQLPKELNEVVVQTYYSCIRDVYDSLVDMFNTDKEEFCKSILPLMGVTDLDIIQVTCFHKEVKSAKYCPAGVLVVEAKALASQTDKVSIMPLKEGISSFEIHLRNTRLQIRIKPMNKFTSAAFKVNCSIKENE
jgi:hypothetical protein